MIANEQVRAQNPYERSNSALSMKQREDHPAADPRLLQLNFSSEPHGISPLFSTLLLTTKELDFRGLPFPPVRSLSSLLHKVLYAAPLCAICILPGGQIPVAELKLAYPITLQGSPGTVLKLMGTIRIDCKDKESVICCEMTIEAGEQMKEGQALIEVRRGDTEIRDCSIVGKRGIGIDGKGACVSVQSCRFVGLAFGIRAEASMLQIERCSFSGISEAGISLRDSPQVNIESCSFEKSLGSGIEISFTSRLSPGLFSIYIDSNTFHHISRTCVLLESDFSAPLPMSIVLRKNKMSLNSQDGIALLHLAVQDIRITGNSIEENRGTGCKVVEVTATQGLRVESNSCSQSSAGYGIYVLGSEVALENNQCFENYCK